jgi:polyisoprenoid-binding protein YceI
MQIDRFATSNLYAMLNKPVIVLILAMFQLSAYAQQTYRIDVKKSKILWSNRQTMGGHYGYLLFNSGSLNYTSGGEPANGSFSLDMNSMRSTDHTQATANQKVDKELRTEGFFAVDRYPGATMNVKQIVRMGAETYKVTGDLTIKGITNPIEFMAAIQKNENAVNVMADLKIHRLKWKIDLQPERNSWDLFSAVKESFINDEIQVSLNLVFNK